MPTAVDKGHMLEFNRASETRFKILEEGSKHRSGEVKQDLYTTSNKHEDSASLVGDLDDKMKLAEHPGDTSQEKQYHKPTYLKVHVKHIDPETLDAFNLAWEWDDVSDSSIWEPSISHLYVVDSADLTTTHSKICVTLS